MKQITIFTTLLALSLGLNFLNAQTVASFATSKNYLCTDEELFLENRSEMADSFFWEVLETGETSSTKNWRIMFTSIDNSPQKFSIKLLAFSEAGQRDSMTREVSVEQGATASFSADSAVSLAVWFYHDCKNYKGLEWDLDDKDAPNNIRYSDSKPLFHFYTKGGTYNPTLIATTDNFCNDTFSVEIVLVDSTISIKEVIPFEYSLYPNPVNSQTIFKAETGNLELRLWITDLQGRLIWENNARNTHLNEPIGQILVSQPTGSYFLHLADKEHIYILKLYK